VQRVSQLISKEPVDTPTFKSLSPRHKDVVSDFYNSVNYDSDDVVKEVETTIDKVSLQHNVKTDVVYDYIDKELGV
jgi:gas vesicle protein